MNYKLGNYLLSAVLIASVWSCGGEPADDSNNDDLVIEESSEEPLENQGENVVYYGTPSLVEVASIMKASGASFSNELLHDASLSNKYTSQNKKALNLGVYGADLTYSAMFEETQESINYLKTVKGMAEEMGLTGAFESEFLQSIEKNITNRDSLLDIITDFFWSADAYLMDNQRAEVASLIIVGGWIESMFIACDMAHKSPRNAEIQMRIGEQKMILKNLILFLSSIKTEEADIASTIGQLKELQAIYKQIELNQSEVEATTDDSKGETVIGSETTVTIDKASLDALCQKLSEIRGSYIQ